MYDDEINLPTYLRTYLPKISLYRTFPVGTFKKCVYLFRKNTKIAFWVNLNINFSFMMENKIKDSLHCLNRISLFNRPSNCNNSKTTDFQTIVSSWTLISIKLSFIWYIKHFLTSSKFSWPWSLRRHNISKWWTTHHESEVATYSDNFGRLMSRDKLETHFISARPICINPGGVVNYGGGLQLTKLYGHMTMNHKLKMF